MFLFTCLFVYLHLNWLIWWSSSNHQKTDILPLTRTVQWVAPLQLHGKCSLLIFRFWKIGFNLLLADCHQLTNKGQQPSPKWCLKAQAFCFNSFKSCINKINVSQSRNDNIIVILDFCPFLAMFLIKRGTLFTKVIMIRKQNIRKIMGTEQHFPQVLF